jgi:hypothetical protein
MLSFGFALLRLNMVRSLLALILILLQGLTALPAPVNLCFEQSGAFCCIGAGEHGCQCECEDGVCCEHGCVHCQGHWDQSHEDASAEHTADICQVTGSDNQHRHLAIYVPDGDSLRSEVSSTVSDHCTLACDLACAAAINPAVFVEVSSPWAHDPPVDVLGFSLIARASVVLRC